MVTNSGHIILSVMERCSSFRGEKYCHYIVGALENVLYAEVYFIGGSTALYKCPYLRVSFIRSSTVLLDTVEQISSMLNNCQNVS